LIVNARAISMGLSDRGSSTPSSDRSHPAAT
jgi:hypothetical protein